ncbi:hypothetical protein H6G41_24160 [Tolypothrix sp. FACHB-123]|uniref:hypothetical protein n=1 Tax=Tolypothrix sp. FACHB-123 TaxID=2692868 RepID=UPI001686ED91|nr:hypothetical protein [Tolypothrix sp. FACHB-123]MBD2357667.1 hypothetical protein [Tolypothrix sp. FACHB-123]
MTLTLNHFDTKTKQDTGVKEKLDNTLAEYLFPGVQFSIGTAYPEATVPEDLGEHNGMTLQFSAGKRMFFANNPTVRQQLYPNPSDGAAYPLPFTPCRTFQELRNVRILVIDDTTGENGSVIANNDAKMLVGDCKGLIDKDFAQANNIELRAFQFRLGIKPQQENPEMRIAKGTLAPARLDKFGESFFRMGGGLKTSNLRTKTGYDMVMATSSFKGRKGEDAIKPGEYMLTIGLGVKAVAQYREHSLGTQILVNYPQAVKQEILPIIKQQAEKLAQDQKDPRRLALRYVETYERRRALLSKIIGIEPDIKADIEDKFAIFDTLSSGSEGEDIQESESLKPEPKDLLMYSLLKTDLENYCQIIEHPKIITELQNFVRKQWVEIATGRSIKFTSGLAQPSLDLQSDEICIPYIQEGEEIIVTRSPLINSNGVITLKNKHLPEMLDGCVYIHPKTAMENMQCDFDGDLLAFAQAKDFPQLAAEVKEKNLPENRYPDIVKKAKVPYQGRFEEIAVSAMENKIGIIANEIQKNVALQCEIDALPHAEKNKYLSQVSAHLGKVLAKYQAGKLQIPDKILQQISQVTQLQGAAIDNNQVENQLQLIQKLLKDCLAELGNELQVAADGPKSALRPEDSIIQYCQTITAYKEIEWLVDKKNPEAFTNRSMKTNGYSPIDLMIKQTNQIFEPNQLVSQPIETFRNLYPGVEYTPVQKEYAQEIKNNYNLLVKQQIELEEQRKLEIGPYMVITSPTSGRTLEITNLITYEPAKNPEFWKNTEINIQIKSRKPTPKMPHHLLACIKYNTSDGAETVVPIGTISLKSVQEHNPQPGMIINQGSIKFKFGISEGMIDALKQQNQEYIESIKNNLQPVEKLQLAAVIHDVSHTEESKKYSGLRRASVAFSLFNDEVLAQLKQLQFTNMRVIGTQFNECANRNFRGEKVAIKLENAAHPRDPCLTARWIIVEGRKLGTIDARSPHLLPGCEAIATITSSPSTSFIVTSLKNSHHKLQIDNINKYAFATHQWQGEQANITLEVQRKDPHQAPIVFAKIGNQILGSLNKQSVNFLQERLATVGRKIHGFTIVGTVSHAPASYVDIVIDPATVKYPEIQIEEQVSQNSRKDKVAVAFPKKQEEIEHKIATVVFFEAPVDQAHQAKTNMVMCNMVKRAVDRAIERGCNTVHFVNASPYKSENSSSVLLTIQQLAQAREDIKIDLSTAANVKIAMQLLKQPNDIVIGVSSIETSGIINYAAHQGISVAAYIPENGEFDRRNLPEREAATQKVVTVKTKDLEYER